MAPRWLVGGVAQAFAFGLGFLPVGFLPVQANPAVEAPAPELQSLLEEASRLWQQGQLSAAMATLSKTLVLARQAQNRQAEGTTLNYIGAVYYDLGKTEEALKSYQQALVIRREVQDCLLYTSPSPRDLSTSRMPSSA